MGWQYNPFTGELDRVGLSASGSNPWVLIEATAFANATTTIDTINNNDFESTLYHAVAYNKAESVFRSFDISVLNNNGSYQESVKGLLGFFNLSIITINNTGSFELQVNNPNAYDITLTLGRLILT
jgi:hypothetical protein